MYDINKREYFTTLGELRMLLAAFPADTKIYLCGADGGYLHIEEGNKFITLDDSDLSEDYAEWYSSNDSRYDDFWEGQADLLMEEHKNRMLYLFSYMGKECSLPF